MSFDWREFLSARGIGYTREGQREIRIQCPWCADLPKRPPLSINLWGKGFYCWRNNAHRGVRNARLIAALLRISLPEARALAGERFQVPDDIGSAVARLLGPGTGERRAALRPLELPREFRAFTDTFAARPFLHYLRGRGFARADILRFTERYGLYYARSGKQRYRVIFTLVRDGQLLAWSGRSIVPAAAVRYLTSSPATDGGDSIGNGLLWFDDLMHGGARLLLVEGPFDALKLRVLGQPATCFFTARPNRAQIELLHDLLPRWRRTVLLLDRGTLPTAISVQDELAGMAVRIAALPPRYKDPAEISSLADLRLVMGGVG